MLNELEAVHAALTAALEERDMTTHEHCGRVAVITRVLGAECGISLSEQRLLQIAAMFHDIGKIGIPDAILLKPASLTPDEWLVMRTHSERGERIFLATGNSMARQVAGIIRHHHEAYDGSGYPDGLSGHSIPLLSRILAAADAYDAMATCRPYRKALDHDAIACTFREARGMQFDPAVTDIVLRTYARLGQQARRMDDLIPALCVGSESCPAHAGHSRGQDDGVLPN